MFATFKCSSSSYHSNYAQVKVKNRPKILVCQISCYKMVPHEEQRACPTCDRIFKTTRDLDRHITGVHDKVRFKCEECAQNFSRRENLKKHINFKHNGIIAKCDQCDYEARNSSKVELHKMSMHEGKFLKCDQCDKQFAFNGGRPLLARHKAVDHEHKRYKCSKCDNTYADKATMQRHFSAVHENNPKVKLKVKCTFCEKLYSSRERLGRHVRGHHLGMSCCQICQKNLSCSLSLKNHMESFHAQDVIQCGMCDFRTKSKVHATKHKAEKHNGIKYTCNECDYESEVLDELRNHQNGNKHQGMKYKCHSCKYRATLQSNLKIHFQAMHEGKTYKCDVCDFRASTPRTVGWHKKVKHV